MKKLLVVFTITGLVMAACNSNKNASSAAGGDYIGAPASKTSDLNNVNRVNETEGAVHAPKNHLDSALLNSGSESKRSTYNRNSTYHNGVSGAGSGSSYAGYGYAQLRYKKKPKKVITPSAPVEQELTDNITDTTKIGNNITDSTGTVKTDSASVNQGW